MCVGKDLLTATFTDSDGIRSRRREQGTCGGRQRLSRQSAPLLCMTGSGSVRHDRDGSLLGDRRGGKRCRTSIGCDRDAPLSWTTEIHLIKASKFFSSLSAREGAPLPEEV